jgi:hypothetical protein
MHRFFPPKHIRGVGSFQDAGPLVDSTLFALCDYLVSVGTGESRPSNSAAMDDMRNVWENGAVPRQALLGEDERQKGAADVPDAAAVPPPDRAFRRRRADADSAPCMSEMGRKARGVPSLSGPIACVRRCMIASLFYFELDALPERSRGRYAGSGTILCTIRRSEAGFQELFALMTNSSAQIVVDGSPLSAVNDPTCFDKGGNFRKQIEVDTHGSLEICLREGLSEPSPISRSPFTIEHWWRSRALMRCLEGGVSVRERMLVWKTAVISAAERCESGMEQ